MKKIFKYVAVVAIVAAAGVTAYNAQSEELKLSDLAMENVEALANGELGAGTCHGTGFGYCPGGNIICCWAHTHVYGKD